MKKVSVILFTLFFHAFILTAQSTAGFLLPQVDKRVELLSIACRLANINGFNDTLNPVYSKAVDKHFNKFSDHPLIKYIRGLKNRLDTAYWEVPALAVHLSQPPALEPLVGYNDTGSGDAWDNRELLDIKLVALIKQFYTDADCNTFFVSRYSYYQSITRQYEKQCSGVDVKWVKNFFGLNPTENYFPVLAIGMNDGAYLRVNFKNNNRDTYTIFGCTGFDANGIPGNFANLMYQRSMLHEYIHAYSNQLIDKNIVALQQPAEVLIADTGVYGLMKNTFYGNWQYILYESLVRASAVKYMMANERDKSTAEKEIIKQEKLGFFWMKGLVQQLDIYENNRGKYKSMEMYMPEVIEYFIKVAEEIK